MFITLHHKFNSKAKAEIVTIQVSHIRCIIDKGEKSQIVFTNGDGLSFEESREKIIRKIYEAEGNNICRC